MIRKVLLCVLAFSAANLAHAGIINFNTCVARCDAVNASFGDDLGILASLEFTDNGAGGVDFVLTNTFSNGFAGGDETFIADLFLNFDLAPSGFSDLSSNISSIDIDVDNIFRAGLSFDSDVDLFDSRQRRLLDGQTASWTFLGITEADVVDTALVNFDSLPVINLGNPDAGDRVRVTGTPVPTTPQSVPEPAGFLLLGAGLALLGRKARLRLA